MICSKTDRSSADSGGATFRPAPAHDRSARPGQPASQFRPPQDGPPMPVLIVAADAARPGDRLVPQRGDLPGAARAVAVATRPRTARRASIRSGTGTTCRCWAGCILRGRCPDCSGPHQPALPVGGAGHRAAVRGGHRPDRPAAPAGRAACLPLSSRDRRRAGLIDIDLHRLPNAIVLPSYPVLALALTLASAVRDDPSSLVRAGIGGAGAVRLLPAAGLRPTRPAWASAT